MARVKRGVTAHARHKKVIKQAKGIRGRAGKTIRMALEKTEKGLQYQYRDRRNRKRDFRGLWIQRINAGAREQGFTYARLMDGLKKAGVAVNRKQLAELAATDAASFTALIEKAKTALAA